ncbi:MAG TPA: Gfo/Idh/MocA family oxidoreductase [Lacipirellulaceae bacterium]|nr:Gfo/Idh/MocA family oxidoreductase [Lacipirellulaceae bacterium]
MNLTPEQRAIGKQNFYESVGTTRREFLAGTVAAAAAGGAGLGAMYFGYGASVENPLRIGIIGTGDEGGVLIGALNPDYVDVVAIADIRPYNQSRAFEGDANNPAARPGLRKVYGWTEQQARDHVKVYKDKYEDLINDDNVEAVIIALPLWLHDVAAFKAMRSGKHILCEKLMAQTIGRCKEMGRMAAESKDAAGNPIVLAVGHQRHYSILYANAVDQIKRGLLGDLHHIRAQWHRANLPGNDSWTPPLPCPPVSEAEWVKLRREARAAGGSAAEQEIIAQYKLAEKLNSLKKQYAAASKSPTLLVEAENFARLIADVEKQLEDISVDAAKYGYESKTLENGRERTPLEELIRWRLWDRTAAGLMAELGSHQLDASSIFISSQRDDGGKVYPLSVQGIGVRSLFPADRDVDDHVHCNFEFPALGYYEDINKQDQVADPNKKIVVTYSSINGNGFGGYGECVMGTKGTLLLEREQEVLLYGGGGADTKIEVRDGKDGKPAMATYETGGGAAVAQAAAPKNVSRGYKEEIEHWAWCIRNPDPKHQPRCTPTVAMADAIIALTSNIAMKQNKRVEFNPKWFKMEDDATPEVELGVAGAAGPRKTSELA